LDNPISALLADYQRLWDRASGLFGAELLDGPFDGKSGYESLFAGATHRWKLEKQFLQQFARAEDRFARLPNDSASRTFLARR
jgi:hypothetical protein